jgi:hypothetical protein
VVRLRRVQGAGDIIQVTRNFRADGATVRAFAQQEFADRHSYALALHTDEPHPRVHLVLKAMTEGREHHVNIRKPMAPRVAQDIGATSQRAGRPGEGHAADSVPQEKNDEAPRHIPTDNS